jgi:hypothetical protein
MNIKTCILCFVPALVMYSCGNRPVVLSVDFNSRPEWNYSMGVTIGGRIRVGDSTTTVEQSLKCGLSGTAVKGEPSALNVFTRDVTLESSMLDPVEKQQILNALDSLNLTFSLGDGFAGVGDSTVVPSVEAGQWGLYRQFARMIPVLPNGKVRPGFSWDRHSQLPISTTQGDASGSVYQSFTFDSLVKLESGRRLAFLSWKFSYTVEPLRDDTAGLLDEMPHKGSGNGAAVMDVDGKYLVKASVGFAVPQGPSSDPYSIEWNETAFIELVE